MGLHRGLRRVALLPSPGPSYSHGHVQPHGDGWAQNALPHASAGWPGRGKLRAIPAVVSGLQTAERGGPGVQGRARMKGTLSKGLPRPMEIEGILEERRVRSPQV